MIKRTRKGWMLEINHCDQGGYRGRRILITDRMLQSVGIDPDADPNTPINEHTTAAQWAWWYARETGWTGDRVIRRGYIVR